MKTPTSSKKYQVQLWSCPCNLPTPFFSHNWIVIYEDNKDERWEVGYMKGIGESNWGTIRRNLLDCTSCEGTTIALGISKRWKARLLGSVEGPEESMAHEMVKFIRSSPEQYPFGSKYSLLGPNSNTYVQWILSNFPDSQLILPPSAIGKGYLKKSNR